MIEPRLPIKRGDEHDLLYNKRIYCYLVNRPKNVRDIKKRINKRERRYSLKVIERELSVA